MLEHPTSTVSFFQAMAPLLTANVLTVTFVYCFAKIHQKELAGEEEGRLTYLWLIILFQRLILGPKCAGRRTAKLISYRSKG